MTPHSDPTSPAEQGIADAQCNLGLAYANGEGVTKDFVEAHAWLNIARAGGDEGIKKSLDELEKLMTKEQIAKATDRVRELIATIKK